MNRREFLLATAAMGAAAIPSFGAAASKDDSLLIATNLYPWGTFAKRRGEKFDANSQSVWNDVAAAGFNGIECNGAPGNLGELLAGSKLALRSLYVNSKLHEPEKSDESIKSILATADAAKPHGCRIIVTNPEPIHWGGPENKSDEQLVHQGKALTKLGRALRERGMVLAYHNHDIELRNAGREFHHMLAGTDPEAVKFCLDAHWVFRGAGNSQVALFDAVKLYGDRIVELHLRQSRDGVWTEAFGPGDIDYKRLAAVLLERGVRPHLVLEQAVEKQTPDTRTVVEAHRDGVAYAREVFAAFAQ